jgi:hypothetical protein
MADTANSKSDYQKIAKTRWRQYAITGNGPFAVVLGCAYRVELCQTPIEASVIVAERCGPMCSHIRTPEGGWHKIERIELPRPRALVTIRDWTD